ncbi:hypothetical protein V6N13_087987 [Hibiscus sabdariffa]|uniref:Secreted protein n=1 Tax=Hibiscus sabdariffa TaxID=183260 RepID=A0ABR2FXX1_9ROSI
MQGLCLAILLSKAQRFWIGLTPAVPKKASHTHKGKKTRGRFRAYHSDKKDNVNSLVTSRQGSMKLMRLEAREQDNCSHREIGGEEGKRNSHRERERGSKQLLDRLASPVFSEYHEDKR